MDNDDSDVEMITGSPVYPQVKNETENDEQILPDDQFERTNVEEETIEIIEESNDQGKDPMDLDGLETSNFEESNSNNNKENATNANDADRVSNANDNDEASNIDDADEISNADDADEAVNNNEANNALNADEVSSSEEDFEKNSNDNQADAAGNSDKFKSTSELITQAESRKGNVQDLCVEEKTQNDENSSDDESKDKGCNTSKEEEANKRIERAMENYPWLCRNLENPNFVFCLYCNTSLKSFFKHPQTHLHNDRVSEYNDFIENIDRGSLRLKTNKDFNGDIKKEREKLEDKFADFIWSLWDKTHDWLIRSTEDYYAICKYCRTKVNVSTSFLRKTHEDGNKHKESKRIAGIKINRDSQKLSNEISNSSTKKTIEHRKNENATVINHNNSTSASKAKKPVESPENHEHYEKSKNSPDLCRCKLCDITMFATSFFRHASSPLHKQNLIASENPSITDQPQKPNWKTYQHLHPWLIEDPINAMEAYCRYCEKRIMHGTSAAKRLIHEHSAPHRAAVKKSVEVTVVKQKTPKKSIVNNDNEQASASSQDDEGSAQDEDEDDENEESGDNESDEDNADEEEAEENDNDSNDDKSESATESENETKTKNLFPNGKNPSWVKPYRRDGIYVFCKYCKKILLNHRSTIRKHNFSKRHNFNGKIFRKRSKAVKNAKRAKRAMETKADTTTIKPVYVKGATTDTLEDSQFPWLVTFKNNAMVVYCKYCGIRFSAASSRLSHEKSKRHVEAAQKFLDKTMDIKEIKEVKEKAAPKLAQPVYVKTKKKVSVIKKAVTQTQLKTLFEWLYFKHGLQRNYGYCIYCEKPIFIPSIKYGKKHSRVGSHMRARNEYRRQEEEKKEEKIRLQNERKIAKNNEENIARMNEENSPLKKGEKNNSKVPDGKNETLKRTADNDANEMRNELPPAKRFKPSSLQIAIKTAKRLTQMHLEMLQFRRDIGRTDLKPVTSPMKMFAINKTPEKSITKEVPTSTPNPSPMVDISAAIPSIIQASQQNNRDPFDLFFTSMSESMKLLPTDLASEGKLKVMQVIFDLETRAHQRQHQNQNQEQQQLLQQKTELQRADAETDDCSIQECQTSALWKQTVQQQHQQQQLHSNQQQQHQNQQEQHQNQQQQQNHQHQQNRKQQAEQVFLTEDSNGVNDYINDVAMYDDNQSEIPVNFVSQSQNYQTQTNNQHIQQSQPQPIVQNSYNATPTNSQNKANGPRNVYIQQQSTVTTPNVLTIPRQTNATNTQRQATILNSNKRQSTTPSNTQQRLPTTSNSQTQIQRNNITNSHVTPQTANLNYTQRNLQQTQNLPTSSTSRDSLLRQHLATTQMNNVNNNSRMNTTTKNPQVTVNSKGGLTISNVGSIDNTVKTPQNKSRMPQIRTVPLNTLTVPKFPSSGNDEPPFHHIQLNSSTQSKIIKIDGNTFHQRR